MTCFSDVIVIYFVLLFTEGKLCVSDTFFLFLYVSSKVHILK